MGIISSIKTNGTLSIYIPCIFLIMCLYIWWIAMYEYDNEFMLGLSLIMLGILYICALYMVTTKHGILGSSVMLITLLVVISIAVTSGFKQAGGAKGSTFLCLGITPMLFGICFALVGAALMAFIAF